MSSRFQALPKRRPDPPRRIRGVAVFGFHLALIALAIVQGLLLFIDSWEVPPPLVARLHEAFEERGLRLSYESLAFRLPATITIVKPQVFRRTEDEPWVEADVGQIDVSIERLWHRELKIDRGTIYGGRLFCPAPVSPTGRRETVLQQTHATFSQEGDRWRIRNVNGMLNNLTFTGSGEIPAPPPEEEPKPSRDWEREIATVLSKLVEVRGTMDRIRLPHLLVSFSPDGNDGLSVALEGFAEAVEAPLDLEVRHLRFTLAANFDGRKWHGDRAALGVAEVVWNSRITARDLRATARWGTTDETAGPLPETVGIALRQIDGAAASWRDVRTEIALADPRRIALELFAFFEDEPLVGTARLDPETGGGRLDLVSRLNPTALFESELAGDFDLPFEIAFYETPFARATAWMENWQFVRASGRAHARQTRIDGVYFHQAAARAELYPDRFVVPEMHLAYEGVAARGSYEVAFDDFSYRLLFAGDLRPLHIREWFGDWWVGLWERFEFPALPLSGDVDIHGRHGHGEETTLFGSVRAEGFTLGGVGFESLAARLRIVGDAVRLFDMNVRRPEGGAIGWFRFEHDPTTDSMKRLDFEAHSTVDPVEVARVFGEAGPELFSMFEFTEPPALLLSGTVYGPEQPARNRITVTGRSPTPLKYYGLPLDHLLIDLLIEDEAWTLRRIDAIVADGEVSGDAWKRREEGEERLGFSLILLDLDLPVLLQAISTWRAGMGFEGASDPVPENIDGIVSGTIRAEGATGDRLSFEGEGSIAIRDANLAEIHLLGLLSRILSATPLRFTSLQFTDAEATFELQRENIHFPTLVLTGPSAEIQAKGDYNLNAETLDFALNVHMLRQSRIPFLPIILSPLLEPLAAVLEIELNGPVADPEWRFLLGPKSLFENLTGGRDNEVSTDENE